MTLRLDRRPSTIDRRSGRGVATSDWAVLDGFPRTGYYSQDTDSWEFGGSSRVSRRASVAGEGLVADRTVALGNHTVHERSAAGQRLRIVAPAGHSPAHPPAAILDVLSRTASALEIGSRDPVMTAFYLPVSSSERKGVARDQRGDTQTVWLFDPGWGLDNTWIHEYVHTRQSYHPARAMRWLAAGSANYYEKLFSLRYGVAGYAEFRNLVRSQGSNDGVLAEPDTWSGFTPYGRGQRVAAALDARIQAATDYRRSLEDVLRRVNDHTGTVTPADFEGIVADVAGENMNGWIDVHVRGKAPVTIPDDPYAYTDPSGDGDPDAAPERARRVYQTALGER